MSDRLSVLITELVTVRCFQKCYKILLRSKFVVCTFKIKDFTIDFGLEVRYNTTLVFRVYVINNLASIMNIETLINIQH